MRKIIVSFIIFLFLASGCTFNVQIMTPDPIQPTPFVTDEVALTIAAPVASLVATISPTAGPTFTPVPPTTFPVFTNARMGASPDDPNGPAFFPAGTKVVYGIWDYQNMRPGLRVRREWYWNGEPWITREEAWDFDKYGANGTIRDISIFDNETGLNSGVYQLRLYIDNVIQPIGSAINSPVQPWITFKIGTDEQYTGYMSPDYTSAVEVFDDRRIVLQTEEGISRKIFIAREVPFVSWFPDGSHFLFVDRDRSAQEFGTNVGIRDDLWMVEVPSGNLQLLYKNDTSFAGRMGPVVSPGGRYIASLQGSGFGDACLVDSQVIFIELASDLKSMRVMRQEEFSGLPSYEGGFIYPVEDGIWQNENSYLVTLAGTCSADQSQLGPYVFDLTTRSASRTSSADAPVPGDLGWGKIHGQVTDAVTGAPVSGATVMCEHHSYTSPSVCSGMTISNADGSYLFENIYFHDTDTLKITAQAAGYQPQEFSQTAFTVADVEVNLPLMPSP